MENVWIKRPRSSNLHAFVSEELLSLRMKVFIDSGIGDNDAELRARIERSFGITCTILLWVQTDAKLCETCRS